MSATACVSCGELTDATTVGEVGDTAGRLCDDCAFWCDGNATPAATTNVTTRARELARKHTKAQLITMCEAAGQLCPMAGWTKDELAIEAARAELLVTA